MTAGELIGPLLGGLVLVWVGAAPLFLLNGLSFVFVAAAVASLPERVAGSEPEPEAGRGGYRDGWRVPGAAAAAGSRPLHRAGGRQLHPDPRRDGPLRRPRHRAGSGRGRGRASSTRSSASAPSSGGSRSGPADHRTRRALVDHGRRLHPRAPSVSSSSAPPMCCRWRCWPSSSSA